MLKTELQVIEMEEVQAAQDFKCGPELSLAELEKFVIKEHYINKCKCGIMMTEEPCLKCGEYNENNQEQ